VHALAEKLEFMVHNPSEARAMGDAARRWVEERYSWDKVGERLEAAYLRIAYALIKHHENLPRT
jgi:glycosyltransferase involved in cell wall biosynthesis